MTAEQNPVHGEELASPINEPVEPPPPEEASNDLTVPEKASPWLLFAMPIGVGLLLGLIITVIRVAQSIDARAFYLGLDGLRFYLFALAGLVGVSAVVILWLRPKFRTLATVAVGLLALGFGVSRLVRVESFYGNMVPRLAWAWTPTPEQQVEEYLVRHERSSSEDLELEKLHAGEDPFAATDSDFAQFLGSQRDGHVPDIQLLPDWEATPPKELWRHPVGLGWSSFAVVGRGAVNLEQRGEHECVVCYDLHSGRELWVHRETVRFEDEHGDGPRSTPTIVDGRVYSMGAAGTLTCLDFTTGELQWKVETLADSNAENLLWGMSGSPLVFEGKVVVTPGGSAGSAVCFDADSGTELWRAGDDPGGYASPVLADIGGQSQILSFNGAGLRAFTREGEATWLLPWLTQGEQQRVNVAQPIVLPVSGTATDASQILISSGYGNGTALVSVRQAEEGQWQVETVWHSQRLKSKMSNFILAGEHVYGLDSGILTCIDVQSGQRVWKRGRYGHGQLLMTGQWLLIQAESGDVVLVRATPEAFEEVTRFPALQGKTWNNMALAGNILVVRNDHEAAAYELPVANPDVF